MFHHQCAVLSHATAGRSKEKTLESQEETKTFVQNVNIQVIQNTHKGSVLGGSDGHPCADVVKWSAGQITLRQGYMQTVLKYARCFSICYV